jgi:hypothetical protein
MNHRLRLASVWTAFSLTLLGVGDGRGARARTAEPAAPGPPAVIAIGGSCPDPEMLAQAVEALIPGHPVVSPRGASKVDITDLGPSYRVVVVVNGTARERVYRDAGRDCEQRARFAAVFVVLTLMPPEIFSGSPPAAGPAANPPEAPPPTSLSPPPTPVQPANGAGPPPPSLTATAGGAGPESPPPASAGTRRRLIELAAGLDAAPAVRSAPETWAPAVELRASWGGRHLEAVLGVALMPRADFDLDGVRGRLDRLPIDVGLRARRPLGAIELAGELGFVAEIFRAEGLNTALPRQQTRLDPGARLGAALRFGQGRFAPTAGVHAIFFPKPYQLETTPDGPLGQTPSLWLGATIGVSASL